MWKLKTALYGLKQAAHEWHKVLVTWLHDPGFERSHSDRALFIRKYGGCFIPIWIDDLLVSKTADVMETLCALILSRFRGRSECEIGHVLGMESCAIEKHRP